MGRPKKETPAEAAGMAAILNKALAKHRNKYKGASSELIDGKDVLPAYGLTVDNPLLEFALDRRFIAYGRNYLIYGKKSASKTSLALELIKIFQQQGGHALYVEVENALDIDFMKMQGVDMSKLSIFEPESFEQGLSFVEDFFKIMANTPNSQKVSTIVVFDSYAGSQTEHESQSKVKMDENKVGDHAKILTNFYRRNNRYLKTEPAIFVALNQLRHKIGGSMPGLPPQETLIGGEAQWFNSTYQLKMDKVKELAATDEYGAKRKFGSIHKIAVKRNKLGREGLGQFIEYDLYIRGGIDWFTPLVRKLEKDYKKIVIKEGNSYKWGSPDMTYINDSGELVPIPDTKMKPSSLGKIIACSDDAKEYIRKVFNIPDAPTAEENEEIKAYFDRRRDYVKKHGTDEDFEEEAEPVDIEDGEDILDDD